jgi:hypothetical protein
MKAGRIPPWSLSVLTAAALIGFGLFELGPWARIIMDQRRTRAGITLISPRDSVVDVGGTRHPMMARDSVTLIIFADAHCGPCRRNAQAYHALSVWSASQGIASRLVLENEQETAAQFGRLAGDESSVLLTVPGTLAARFRIFATPTSILVDRHGVVLGRWQAGVPRHLELLNLMGRLKIDPS